MKYINRKTGKKSETDHADDAPDFLEAILELEARVLELEAELAAIRDKVK